MQKVNRLTLDGTSPHDEPESQKPCTPGGSPWGYAVGRVVVLWSASLAVCCGVGLRAVVLAWLRSPSAARRTGAEVFHVKHDRCSGLHT